MELPQTLTVYRNKKEPQRGRKPRNIKRTIDARIIIERKKLPKGDGNVMEKGVESASLKPIEIKKIPIGDEVSFLVFCLIYKKIEFLIMMLEGSRTSKVTSIFLQENLKKERKMSYVHL